MLSYLACLVGGSNCLSDSSSKLTFFLAGAMFIMLSVWAGLVSVGSARRYLVLSIRASYGMGLGVSGRSKIALVITPAVIPPATTAGMLCATYFPTFFAPPKTDRPTLAALEGSAARSAAAIARFKLVVGLARSAAAFARSAAAIARFKLLLLTAIIARSKPSVIVRPILSTLLSGGATI